MAVFTRVAHIEHRPTLIKEIIKALSELESLVIVFTIMKTKSNHTTGDTGLNTCINQLTALRKVLLKPITIPIAAPINSANTKPAKPFLNW